MMKKIIITLLLFGIAVFAGYNAGQDDPAEIQYDVSFPNAVHNEAEITLTLRNLSESPVTISMSRTSPGRYALHEFAKNIYNVEAVNGKGEELEMTRPDLHNWLVHGHSGTVEFSYTLYANHADGTYSGINEQHAHLNIPSAFAFIKNLEKIPLTIQFHPPENTDWKVATQLQETDNPYIFEAPDFNYFLDSPIELSDFMVAEWEAPDDTLNQTIRLAVHHNGSQQQVDAYAEMAQKVVAEQIAVFGSPPDFEYNRYTFIADYLPYVYGDGMEHRNSTILTSTRPLEEEDALRNLYTLSHEFFHSWNVERIRPGSLEPFNFMEANVSGALWFAEGFTSYYDDLTIRRAGLIDNEKYANDWSGTLNYVLNSPGNNFYSPVEMSMQAPFVDAATSVDAQNKSNTFISYYSWGAVIGLGLDLMLRSNFDQLTLDDYMRRMWHKYGKTEEPYQIEDLRQALAEVTDSTEFADHFFDSFIYQGNHIDLKPLLEKAGFLLRKANPGRAVITFDESAIDYESGAATIVNNTIIGSPLYKAGLDNGDIIRSVGGQVINNAQQMNRLLASRNPGGKLTIQYESLGETYESTIELAEDQTLELLTFEQGGREVTDKIVSFRENWIGSKINQEL